MNIGYCGVDCLQCVDYKKTKCPGCKEAIELGAPCNCVICNLQKKIEYCNECLTFPCEMMKEFYQESKSHKEAYKRMLEMKEGK